ncbi:MAG: hypothetical protein AB1700_16500, partial [Bacillota bacterium]
APPKTWDELTNMAKTIQDGERKQGNKSFWGFVWQGNRYEGLACDALEWQASFGGGTIIERDGKITVNNPKTAAALRMAKSWVDTISPPGVTTYAEEDARAIWQFFSITLPLLRQVILVALVFRTLDALRVFDVIFVLTAGASGTESMATYSRRILIDFQQLGYGSSISVVIFLIIAFFTVLYMRILGARQQ